MIQEITSVKNSLIRSLRELTKARSFREETASFLAEGEHMVTEALAGGCVSLLIVDKSRADRYASILSSLPDGTDCVLTTEQVFCAICETRTPQGIAARCRFPDRFPAPRYPGYHVALNAVQDPGNVGTILRTMDAAGFDTLYIDQKTADPFSPKCSRATMGAVFRIRIERCSTLEEPLLRLKQAGVPVISGDLRGSDLFGRPPLCGKGACLLIGNEGSGIEPGIKAISDLRVRIPMPGRAESLNASVSAGILIYDLLREAMG